MPQYYYSGDVGSIDHPEDSITVFSSTIMRESQVEVSRSSSDQRSSSSDPAATSSFSTMRSVRYLECQRNHAAAIGGYAVDGCREFMASGEEGDNALTCAACGCHRSFHRRELVA